jgi:deazaflavin-dependent oxidoreductase (nitroreductase family)
MAEKYPQEASGAMTYPAKGTLNRIIFKSPLIGWRMGLGSLMSHPALGGNKMLVLTTWGRRSQLPRHTMLTYASAGGKEYLCSGWGPRSDWYQNIIANPAVTVQTYHKTYTAKARQVQGLDEFTQVTQEMFASGGDTHFTTWLESLGIQYDPQDMIDKRERLYILALDPSEETGPAPLEADLTWVWGVMAAFAVGLWLAVRGKKGIRQDSE